MYLIVYKIREWTDNTDVDGTWVEDERNSGQYSNEVEVRRLGSSAASVSC